MKKTVSFFKNIVLIFILSTLVNISAKAQSEVVNTSSTNNVYFDTGIFPGAHIFINYERKVHVLAKISFYV